MPAVFRYKGYRFFFFSNEGNPREPMHVHVRKDGAVAKFWLLPEAQLADSYGMTPPELTELLKVVEEKQALIERCWHEHFDD